MLQAIMHQRLTVLCENQLADSRAMMLSEHERPVQLHITEMQHTLLLLAGQTDESLQQRVVQAWHDCNNEAPDCLVGGSGGPGSPTSSASTCDPVASHGALSNHRQVQRPQVYTSSWLSLIYAGLRFSTKESLRDAHAAPSP